MEHFILSSGTSVKCDNRTLLIELLTSYEERYYEAYYAELRDTGDDKTLRNLKIYISSKTSRHAICKNCDISEAFIEVIEIVCETSQISATSHTSSSSYDSHYS